MGEDDYEYKSSGNYGDVSMYSGSLTLEPEKLRELYGKRPLSAVSVSNEMGSIEKRPKSAFLLDAAKNYAKNMEHKELVEEIAANLSARSSFSDVKQPQFMSVSSNTSNMSITTPSPGYRNVHKKSPLVRTNSVNKQALLKSKQGTPVFVTEKRGTPQTISKTKGNYFLCCFYSLFT